MMPISKAGAEPRMSPKAQKETTTTYATEIKAAKFQGRLFHLTGDVVGATHNQAASFASFLAFPVKHPYGSPYVVTLDITRPPVTRSLRILVRPLNDRMYDVVGLNHTFGVFAAARVSDGIVYLLPYLAVDDTHYKGVVVAFSVVATLHAALNDSTVRQTHKPGIRANKPLVGSATKLHLPSGYTTAIRPVGTHSAHKGGTHASPIPHTRRGHLRVRNGAQFWVRDTVVNRQKGPVVPRGQYEVAA